MLLAAHRTTPKACTVLATLSLISKLYWVGDSQSNLRVANCRQPCVGVWWWRMGMMYRGGGIGGGWASFLPRGVFASSSLSSRSILGLSPHLSSSSLSHDVAGHTAVFNPSTRYPRLATLRFRVCGDTCLHGRWVIPALAATVSTLPTCHPP